MGSKYKNDKAFAEEFPFFSYREDERELDRKYEEWCNDQDECKNILNTIRILENIILNNFNSEHVVYPQHFVDRYIGWYLDEDDD